VPTKVAVDAKAGAVKTRYNGYIQPGQTLTTFVPSSGGSGGGGNRGDVDPTPTPEPTPTPTPTPEPNGDVTPDSPFLNENGESGSGITRQQWISDLVNHAGLSMYNTNLNSSFSDVDEDNPFSWAIEIALQNGAIAISAAENNQFYPAHSATEAFAVVSAVRALGFVYTDLASCYTIANDCGIFEGAFSTNILTTSQAEAILNAVDEIIAPIAIDPTAEQVVNLGDDTQVLTTDDSIENYSFDDAAGRGRFIASGDEISVEIGDCVILPPSAEFPGGLAQKVVNIIEAENDTLIFETTTPDLGEIMGDGEVDVQGTAEANVGLFTVNDTLSGDYDIVYEDSNSDPEPLSREVSMFAANNRPKIKITDDYVEVEFSKEIVDRVDANGKARIYFPDVDYIVDLDWFLGIPVGVNELRFALTNKAEFEGEIEVVGSKNDILGGLELGRVPIPLGASGFTVDIVLFVGLSAKGTIAISYELESTVGVQYKNGHLRTINQSRSDLTFTPFEVEIEGGPNLSAMLTLFSVFDLADITASGGVGVNASVTVRNTENICVDGTAYVYLRLTALRNSLIGELLNLSFSKTIWDKNNSIWKKSLHFEGTPTHVGVVPECTFGDGEMTGMVKDASTELPITSFTIHARKTDGDGNAEEISGSISANGSFNIDHLPAGTYRIQVNAPNYRTYTRENIAIRVNQTNNIGTILLVSSSVTDGSASGYVSDTQTGAPVIGATVMLYQGDGTSSPTGQSTITGSTGEYSFSGIAIGNYTIVVSISNYATASRSIVVTQNGTGNQNVSLVPLGIDTVDVGTISQIGDLRIVLTWGQNPSDLDSHLCGPTATGAERFHVYFADRNYNENERLHAFLDHDDITSYGPETTTVYDINTSGRYSFYVHDFSNGGAYSSYALSESDATVRVYVKEATGDVNDSGEALYRAKLIGTFYVPTTTSGTLWHVFDYNAATGLLTARNTMTVDEGAGNVGSRSLGGDAPKAGDEHEPDILDADEQTDIDRIRQDMVTK
jgi:uncharacterized protein YfaP (DUF2135 family)